MAKRRFGESNRPRRNTNTTKVSKSGNTTIVEIEGMRPFGHPLAAVIGATTAAPADSQADVPADRQADASTGSVIAEADRPSGAVESV